MYNQNSPYSWSDIGGFFANGHWIRVGSIIERENPFLGYRQPVRVLSACCNGQNIWVSFEKLDKSGNPRGMNTDVDYSTEKFFG